MQDHTQQITAILEGLPNTSARYWDGVWTVSVDGRPLRGPDGVSLAHDHKACHHYGQLRASVPPPAICPETGEEIVLTARRK